MPRYWIGVVTQDHVARAVEGRFVQVSHGRAGPLERMRPGDGFAYYSPRSREGGGEVLQSFTAIGRVTDGPLERADGSDGEPCFRRGIEYLPANAAPIRPLLDALSFIRSRPHWGAAFRFGFLPIPEDDFRRIAQAMACRIDDAFPPAAHASASASAAAGVSSG